MHATMPCMTYARNYRNAPSPAEPCAGFGHDAEPAQLLRSREAAHLLAISERKLWELQNAGKIPVVREGRMVRYLVSDLDHWISARRSGGQE